MGSLQTAVDAYLVVGMLALFAATACNLSIIYWLEAKQRKLEASLEEARIAAKHLRSLSKLQALTGATRSR